MSERYKFNNPDGLYFVSFSVVSWVNVFTRKEYFKILVDSLKYCQNEKGMEIHAWCIMTNHVHLVFRSSEGKPGSVLRDFKKFTSKKLIRCMECNPQDGRKTWVLKHFRVVSDCNGLGSKQFWRHDNHPIELYSARVKLQKVNYVHMNPVKAGFVDCPEHYVFSSARNYIGMKGLLDVVICY